MTEIVFFKAILSISNEVLSLCRNFMRCRERIGICLYYFNFSKCPSCKLKLQNMAVMEYKAVILFIHSTFYQLVKIRKALYFFRLY